MSEGPNRINNVTKFSSKSNPCDAKRLLARTGKILVAT